MKFQVGDWIQALSEITEEDFMDELMWVHAHKGAVGHVLHVVSPEILTTYWEHSGTTTDVHIDEVKRLCNYDASVIAR